MVVMAMFKHRFFALSIEKYDLINQMARVHDCLRFSSLVQFHHGENSSGAAVDIFLLEGQFLRVSFIPLAGFFL